ncbi:methylenetetrahydrofolate reductase (NADPH) [Rhizobiales bacterium GAS191]|jgi:methylenetetrahydrofolate reductase (NADPH)|nr:methylenetetrahydrofolate reductase (NADPH) [Rhizobiales bacterium GAS113]SED69928.1 methylenetetrahydrofolate reductase (NADPH) [Rhizobiales bacterium GAS191]SEE72677.1 methylenetetrahydrofolate reductase (NADPH) [Rhizobiales bacterium GAS188]
MGDRAMMPASQVPQDVVPPQAQDTVPTQAQDIVSQIVAFMQRASMEATRPTPADAEMLSAVLPHGTDIFLSAVPRRPRGEVIAAARAIRTAGLNPVPHIAARAYPSLEAAREHLARLRDEADIRALLVIGGDLDQPAGDILEARQLIESGVLPALGIERVGIAGHPAGHPRMSDEELESVLVTKIAAAQSSGLEVEIVTQFCFEPATIIDWIAWLRRRGVNLPVRIGLAGPTSLMTWLNYARRCGVRASAEGLARRSGLVKHLFNAVAPDSILRALAQARQAELPSTDRLGDVSAHFYSFGGIGPTARWVASAMHGAITLDKEGGFQVEHE